MDELFISMAISVILQTVKNPAKKAAVRLAMLKIWRVIGQTYAGDPDFKQ